MSQMPPSGQIDAQAPVSQAAVWSLVLGILGVLCLGAFAGIPAIICGHRARDRVRQDPSSASGAGMALAGLILGYTSTAVTVLVFLAVAFVLLVATQGSALSPFIYSLF